MSSHAAVTSGPPHAHHWDPQTAYSGAKLGMWLFLATEILLFGVLFTSFALYRWAFPAEFHEASGHLKISAGAINTAVLIFSSYLVALGVGAAQRGDNETVKKMTLISIICGLVFLCIKSYEYFGKFSEGLFPATHGADWVLYFPALVLGIFLLIAAALTALGFAAFHFQEYSKFYKYIGGAILVMVLFPFLVSPLASVLSSIIGAVATLPEHTHYAWRGDHLTQSYKMYFGLYYVMTGLHALHVILGMGILFWVHLLARRNRFSAEYYTPMEIGGLYWHLVDLIWIYLFPLLYLID